MDGQQTTPPRAQLCSAWDGSPLATEEKGEISLLFQPEGLTLNLSAHFWNDPAPDSAPGSTERLWEYEVLELFLLGRDQQYLEIEFGPHGHYLALEFRGSRNCVRQGMSIKYQTEIVGDSWKAKAHLDSSLLPVNTEKMNFYAIHGTGKNRRYLAWAAPLGDKPDFHHLPSFVPFK